MCALGEVVLIAFVAITASPSARFILAPNVCNSDSIWETSLMSGKRRMVTGSRVSNEAASIGSTAFLDVPILHVP
jgi:hypothetical protein